MKKHYFDETTIIEQYVIGTGKDSPRALIAFNFDESSYYKKAELGRNHVMERFFRNVFIHEGSNPFKHGVFGPVVAYYLDPEEGCPSVDMDVLENMEELVRALQVQASKDWNRVNIFHGTVFRVHVEDESDTDS
jgi:hypothetical protein